LWREFQQALIDANVNTSVGVKMVLIDFLAVRMVVEHTKEGINGNRPSFCKNIVKPAIRIKKYSATTISTTTSAFRRKVSSVSDLISTSTGGTTQQTKMSTCSLNAEFTCRPISRSSVRDNSFSCLSLSDQFSAEMMSTEYQDCFDRPPPMVTIPVRKNIFLSNEKEVASCLASKDGDKKCDQFKSLLLRREGLENSPSEKRKNSPSEIRRNSSFSVSPMIVDFNHDLRRKSFEERNLEQIKIIRAI